MGTKHCASFSRVLVLKPNCTKEFLPKPEKILMPGSHPQRF